MATRACAVCCIALRRVPASTLFYNGRWQLAITNSPPTTSNVSHTQNLLRRRVGPMSTPLPQTVRAIPPAAVGLDGGFGATKGFVGRRLYRVFSVFKPTATLGNCSLQCSTSSAMQSRRVSCCRNRCGCFLNSRHLSQTNCPAAGQPHRCSQQIQPVFRCCGESPVYQHDCAIISPTGDTCKLVSTRIFSWTALK